MPLSEDEQRILQQIEQQFYASDPDLAGEIGTHSLYTHCLRQLRWAIGGFVVGLVVLTGALFFAASFLVAFAGFVVMLATALLAERAIRRMGRAGIDQLTARFREGSLGAYLGESTGRVRGRLHRVDDADDDVDDEA
ncbi:MAG: DUF3040 domain-containing protein [Acidimicrobiales bacterium]